jgi:hypothetical protein
MPFKNTVSAASLHTKKYSCGTMMGHLCAHLVPKVHGGSMFLLFKILVIFLTENCHVSH